MCVLAKVRVICRCRNTLDGCGVLGVRVQPNHPTDDLGGILTSALEGLSYRCGHAVIGVNPHPVSRVSMMATWQTVVCVAVVAGPPPEPCRRRTYR